MLNFLGPLLLGYVAIKPFSGGWRSRLYAVEKFAKWKSQKRSLGPPNSSSTIRLRPLGLFLPPTKSSYHLVCGLPIFLLPSGL